MTRRPVEPQMPEILLDDKRYQNRFSGEKCKALKYKNNMYVAMVIPIPMAQFKRTWDEVDDEHKD